MSNKTLFGSGPKRDEDDEDERPASGSAPFASRQPFGRPDDRKPGSAPAGSPPSGSGGQRSPTFGGQSGQGGVGSRSSDPPRSGGGTGAFPRTSQGGDRDKGSGDRPGGGSGGGFGRPSGGFGSSDRDKDKGSKPAERDDRPGGFGRPSGGFGSSDRDKDKGSKPAERDDRPGGFGRPSGGFGSSDRDKDKGSIPADQGEKSGGGLLGGRFGRGGDKKEEARPGPAKLGPAGKPDDKGKDAKAGGGLGGLLGGLRRGGDETNKKPDANKPAAIKPGASGEQKAGGGFLSRLGGGGDKKDAPKPGAPAPLKSPGAAKPNDKPQGGGIRGFLNRNKQEPPKDSERPGAPKIGAGPLGGSGSGGASGFQPQPRSTGQMPGVGKPGAPAPLGGAKPDAKSPAKVPDKSKSAGGGGLGARLGNLFGRGEAKAGTALVSQTQAVAPPKGAKAGAVPPARLDRQAKPLDYSQTQVAVRHRGLSLDQKLDLLGYALIFAALVIFFGLIQPNEGTFTTAIVNVLGGFFGAARYIIPLPVLAIGAWLLIRHFKENPFIELDLLRIIGLIMLFLTLVTTCHFVMMLTTVVYSWEELAEVSAKFVDLQWGGGWVGDRLYYILIRISGEYGIVALLIAAWIVSIMLTFEITLAEVSTYVKSVFGWIGRKRTGFGEWRQVRGEAMAVQREARAKARAEREAQKAARAAGPVSIERPVAGAIPAAATLGAGAAGIATLGDRPAPAPGGSAEPARLASAPATARFNAAPAAATASAGPAPVAVTEAPPANPPIPAVGPAPVGHRNRSVAVPAAPPVLEAGPESAREDTPLSAPVARPAPMPIGSRTASKPAPESVKTPEPDLDDEEELEPAKPAVAARPAPLGGGKAVASTAPEPAAEAAKPAAARPPGALSGKTLEQQTEPERDAQDTRPLERTGPLPASSARPSPFRPLGKEIDKPDAKSATDDPPDAPRFAALSARPTASVVSAPGAAEGVAKPETPSAPAESEAPKAPAKEAAPAERPPGGLFGARPAANKASPFARPASKAEGETEAEAAHGKPPTASLNATPERAPILGARPSPFNKPSAKADDAAAPSAPVSGDIERAPSRPAPLGSQPAGARPAPVNPRPGISTGTFSAARPAPKPGQSTPAPAERRDADPEDAGDDLTYEPVESGETTEAADVESALPASTTATPPRPASFVSGAARPSPFSPFGKRPAETASGGSSDPQPEAATPGTGRPLPAPFPSRADAFKPAEPASKPAPQDELDEDEDGDENGNGENGDEVSAIPPDPPIEPVLHISEVTDSGYVPPETRLGWAMPDFRELLEKGSQAHIQEDALRQRAKVIEDTLEAFGAPGRVVVTNPGPVITQFGVEPGYLSGRQGKTTRVKVGAIAKLDDDLALALSARSIRIEAPVPGKSYVGIEVPNAETALVGLRDIVASTAFNREKYRLPIALGKSVDGTPIVADLTQMPHMLIAGTTGSGKSVCVNAVISCLLLENTPDDLQMIMVDPKRVELTGYNGIPHLVSPVVVDLERIVGVLKWVTREMEERYKKFSATGSRNIVDYNGKIGPHDKRMAYLVVVVDELADLMMLAPDETEKVLTRLAQMARATGIHLIISTQRPSVDVVTGLIKANFPARISFAVASSVDSRVVLDQPGAEKLLGRGDMLYQAPDAAAPVRMQGVFVSDNEINRITRHWKEAAMTRRDAKPPTSLSVSGSDLGRPMGGGGGEAPRANPARLGPIAVSGSPSQFNEKAFFNAIREPEKTDDDTAGEDDDLYQEAVDAFQAMGKISVSLLQRRLRIGFNRAARLIDLMKQRGVLGASDVAEADGDEEE